MNFVAPLNLLSLKTAFPSIIMDAFPLFFSILFIVSIVCLSFNNPLLIENSFDIFIMFLNWIFLLFLINSLIFFNDSSAASFILFLVLTFVIIDLVEILLKYLQ